MDISALSFLRHHFMTGGHKTAWLNLQIAAVFEKIFKGEWVNSSYKQHCFKHNCVIMCDTVTKFNDECMMSKFSMFSNNYSYNQYGESLSFYLPCNRAIWNKLWISRVCVPWRIYLRPQANGILDFLWKTVLIIN